MGYWLDYSAAKLSASTVRNAGHSGVIRYIDAPQNLKTKHTNKAEYDDFVRNGVPVLLVFEVSTTDPSGGYNQGVAYAQRAKAGADYLGYKGPIFFCNDAPGLSNVGLWRAYLDGAAAVLGRDRIGAYGFYNAMDAAVGHATYFWQAGRRSDVRSHVHIWQDNNTQINVGGITCDRNVILKEVQPAPQNNIVKREEDYMLQANTYEGKVDAEGNAVPQRFVFIVPTLGGSYYSQSCLSVKSGWGNIDSVTVWRIKSSDSKTAEYVSTQTWTDVKQDGERVFVPGVDGMDQYSVQVYSKVPFAITIEAKLR